MPRATSPTKGTVTSQEELRCQRSPEAATCHGPVQFLPDSRLGTHAALTAATERQQTAAVRVRETPGHTRLWLSHDAADASRTARALVSEFGFQEK